MSDSDFFQKVYEVVKQIPYGKITTYGAIARKIDASRSARMVGYALNSVPADEEIPAHRVVNRKGVLTGKHHFQGTNLMQQLLESEGVKIKDNTVQRSEERRVGKECMCREW